MDYRLKPLAANCAATGEPLLPGETVTCVLTPSNDPQQESFDRLDYSQSGWDTLDETARDEFHGVWKATVPPPEKKKPGLDVDEQMTRFLELVEEDAPHQGPLTYVLALWLVRKRRLKMGGVSHEEGVDRLQVTGTHGEGVFEIRDQTLGLADIQTLQAALFGVELPDVATPHEDALPQDTTETSTPSLSESETGMDAEHADLEDDPELRLHDDSETQDDSTPDVDSEHAIDPESDEYDDQWSDEDDGDGEFAEYDDDSAAYAADDAEAGDDYEYSDDDSWDDESDDWEDDSWADEVAA